MTKSRLVLVLNLIGWENGASFLGKLESEVKQNRSNPGVTIDTQLKIVFNFETITSQTGNVLFCDNLSEKFGTAKQTKSFEPASKKGKKVL